MGEKDRFAPRADGDATLVDRIDNPKAVLVHRSDAQTGPQLPHNPQPSTR